MSRAKDGGCERLNAALLLIIEKAEDGVRLGQQNYRTATSNFSCTHARRDLVPWLAFQWPNWQLGGTTLCQLSLDFDRYAVIVESFCIHTRSLTTY